LATIIVARTARIYGRCFYFNLGSFLEGLGILLTAIVPFLETNGFILVNLVARSLTGAGMGLSNTSLYAILTSDYNQ